VAEARVRVISGLKQFGAPLKHARKRRVVEHRHDNPGASRPMLTLIALSAALLQDPPAPPAPPAPPEVRTHFAHMGDGPNRLDANGDGEITREEFAAPMTEAFGRMDRNGDGRLTTAEMAEAHGPGGGHDVMMRRVHGGPGREPHRFEFRHPGPGGEGEAREIVVMRGPGGEGGQPHRIELRPHPGGERTVVFVGEGGPHGDMGPGEHRIRVHAMDGEGHGHGDMDKDGDGKISEAEFVGPLREAFARMDADRSGFIEEGERGGHGDVRVFTHRVDGPHEE
jgi:hypothetical protein